MSRALSGTANSSGPSIGASSLVTDANSSLSGGGRHLQRSASNNTESYMRLPASPISFSSNNISISGSSVMDGSSVVQQSSQPDQQRQQHKRGSSATSQPTPQTGQVPAASLSQEPNNLLRMQKKPRLDIGLDDILQQQFMQQMLQRQESLHNPQLQALIQQQQLMQRHQQQQQMLQSMPQMQRAHMQQQQQQQQIRHIQQHGVPPVSVVKRLYESGVCARRLMQYMYHQRHRPSDNSILYWRKFVAEYFSPHAKKRWCLSLYDNVGQHALGVFPQVAMDAWHCDICASKSGRGFETTFEVLPRLSKIQYDSGVIDELLFVDMPHECRLPSGIMTLEYGKAIQESVYEQLRVVREGKLRIIFAPDLKILSWEFCARRHEELLPRSLVAPQVNQLAQAAQNYQNNVDESGSAGVSSQDLQKSCNMFATGWRQLARNLELQSLNDLGFSKRYVRCLQISEVVNSMKDLIDFSREHNIGPIECLKNYPREAATAKLQIQKMQDMEQLVNVRGMPTDLHTLNKIMALHPGLSTHAGSNNTGTVVLNSPTQTAVALSNYQNLLRQNSINQNPNILQQDPSCSYNGINQAQAPNSSIPVTLQNTSVNALSNPQHHQENKRLLENHPKPAQVNQQLQQHVIQQLLQEMMSNNGGQNVSGNLAEDIFNGANNTGCIQAKAGPLSNVMGMMSKRSNSFKAVLPDNSGSAGGNSFNHHYPDLVPDVSHEFTENGAFNTDPGDASFGWKV